MVKKKKGVARNVTLEADVDTVLLEYMKVQGITNVSRAVNDAIKYALFPEHRDDRKNDEQKLNHKIFYSLNEHRKKTARDFAVMQEILLQYILSDYKQNPASLKEDENAQKRLDDLMGKVINSMDKYKGMDESK